MTESMFHSVWDGNEISLIFHSLDSITSCSLERKRKSCGDSLEERGKYQWATSKNFIWELEQLICHSFFICIITTFLFQKNVCDSTLIFLYITIILVFTGCKLESILLRYIEAFGASYEEGYMNVLETLRGIGKGRRIRNFDWIMIDLLDTLKKMLLLIGCMLLILQQCFLFVSNCSFRLLCMLLLITIIKNVWSSFSNMVQTKHWKM